MKIPNSKKTILKNGLTILTEEIPSLRSVAMGVLVGAGSGNESESEAGLSHLIEHMVFKGTKKRSAYEIAHTLDAVGGKMNAYTGKDVTMYYAVTLDKHLDIAMDILADLLLNARFEERLMLAEKSVILEEIKMYEDTPDELIHDYFAGKILHGHPIGRPTIGTVESVKGFGRKDILEYQKKWYTPHNTIISLAGAIPKDALARLKKYFEKWEGTGSMQAPESVEIMGSMHLQKKKTEQVHLCLGTKGVSQVDEDRYTYSLLDNILGGSMSSRLFQEIREKRGLAYSVYSTAAPFKHFGIAYVYAGCSKENLEEVIGLILKQFSLFKKEGVSKEELDRARENLKGSLVLGLESTSARMSWMAKTEFFLDNVKTIDDIFAEVDKVTQDDIMRLANRYFKDKYLTLAVIGDLNKLPIDKLAC